MPPKRSQRSLRRKLVHILFIVSIYSPIGLQHCFNRLIGLLKRSVVLLKIQSKILWYDVFDVWSYFISVFSFVLSSELFMSFSTSN